MPLTGKIVAVTGGGRGIGLSIAKECALLGASVAIGSRTETELRVAAKEIADETGAKILPLVCDVSKGVEVSRFIEESEKQLGPLYGLVCAAGVYGPIGRFVENSVEEWQKALEINVMGTVRAVQSAARLMLPRKSGRIILFSGGGQGAMENFTCYTASKGAIWRFTESIAAELAAANIYVNAIAPGAVNTKLLDDLIAAGPQKVGETFYKKSLEQKKNGGTPPEKGAKLVAYLLSEQSKGLYGKILSAVWDPYLEFKNLDEMSRSDLYTVRRVVTPDGRTRTS